MQVTPPQTYFRLADFAPCFHLHSCHHPCSVKRQSDLAELMRRTDLIVWDEAPMMPCNCFQAVERMLRDIMQNNVLFGGKVLSARVPPPCCSDRDGS